MDETAHRWLAQSDGIKPSTKQKYRMILASFERYSGNCEGTKIDRKLALEYVDHIKRTPSERTGERLSPARNRRLSAVCGSRQQPAS